MNQKTHQIVLDSPFLERCIFCSHHLIHSCLYLPPLALWSSMWLLYDAWSKQLVVASVGGGWEWLFIFHSLSNATVADSDTCWVVQTETGKMKEIRRCEIFRFSCLNDSFTNGSVSLPTHVWLTIPYHHNNRQQCLHKFLVVNFRILQISYYPYYLSGYQSAVHRWGMWIKSRELVLWARQQPSALSRTWAGRGPSTARSLSSRSNLTGGFSMCTVCRLLTNFRSLNHYSSVSSHFQCH